MKKNGSDGTTGNSIKDLLEKLSVDVVKAREVLWELEEERKRICDSCPHPNFEVKEYYWDYDRKRFDVVCLDCGRIFEECITANQLEEFREEGS